MKRRNNLTEGRLNRIIKESINRVINEGVKGVDPDNVVPQDVAEKYGFEQEYGGFDGGLELWGKYINLHGKNKRVNNWVNNWKWEDPYDLSPNQLLRALGISRFTTQSGKSKYGGVHVRITVEPKRKKAMPNGRGWDEWNPNPGERGEYA
jgi:hypothetical protein